VSIRRPVNAAASVPTLDAPDTANPCRIRRVASTRNVCGGSCPGARSARQPSACASTAAVRFGSGTGVRSGGCLPGMSRHAGADGRRSTACLKD
jgi:hypothetical protein